MNLVERRREILEALRELFDNDDCPFSDDAPPLSPSKNHPH